MESMSRERRPFHALEVDDDEAYSRLLKSRRDSRLQSKRPENDSLRWLIPGLSCLCADDSLRVSYEDLEERFFGLEERRVFQAIQLSLSLPNFSKEALVRHFRIQINHKG